MINKLKLLLNKKQKNLTILLFIGILISSVLEMVGVGAIPVFINLLLKPDELISYLPQSNFTTFFSNSEYLHQILFATFFLLAFFLFKNLFLFFIIFLQAKIFYYVTINNSKRLFQAYVNSPYYLHLNRNPAVTARNVTTEMAFTSKYIECLLLIAREILVIIAIFILLLIVDPITVLIVFFVVGFFAIAYHLFLRKKITKLSKTAQFYRGQQIRLVNQVFGAFKDTKIFNRELYFTNKFKDFTIGTQQLGYFYNIVSKLPRLFLEILGVIVILLVTILFVVFKYPPESFIPMLALLGAATIRILPSFNTITTLLMGMRSNAVSFDLVGEEFIKLKKYIYENNSPGNGKIIEKRILNKNVELKNIIYNYPDSNKTVLNNLSLEIQKGTSIGIIGATGTGKSTLVDIILGLLTPTDGQVLVDGDDINIGNNYLSWQSQIGYIPQDIYLIDDTIKKNIAFGLADRDISDEDINHSLEAAQLNDFVSSLPLKTNTIIGNRGIRLSGGQRQRIGIARALYRKSKVLVFDEATSSLDFETEKAIVECIENLKGKVTLIIITHRLHTLKNFKKIYFIKDGSIANSGSYKEIIENKNIFKS